MAIHRSKEALEQILALKVPNDNEPMTHMELMLRMFIQEIANIAAEGLQSTNRKRNKET